MANMIKFMVTKVVHPMQFGFVQGRSNNNEAILQALSTLDWVIEQEYDHVIINMDLDKVYDMVKWDFVLTVLHKVGIREKFCTMVSTMLC